MSRVKSRREQYSEATRAALLTAATRRFADQGFVATALEDIAADIQATRGAIYHHFANKTALFVAVFEELETEAMALSIAAAEAQLDPWHAAFASLEAFLERCCDPVYGRIVWQEAPIALGWQYWQEAEEKFAYGVVEQLIKALIDGGYLDPLPVEPTTRLVFGMLGAAGAALAQAPEADKQRQKAQYVEMISRMATALRPSSADLRIR